MIKFLSKAFGVCVIIASIILFVAGLVGGYLIAGTLMESAGSSSAVLRLIGIIVGGIISFIFVVLLFGYMAQIVDMRRRMENLEKIAINVFTEKIVEEENN